MSPSSSSSSTAALVAGSAALLALVGYVYSASPLSSSSKSLTIAEVDEDDEERGEFIRPEEVAEIFNQLFVESQSVMGQLMAQVQQIQMAGQRIPPRQVQAILQDQLTKALEKKQRSLLEEMDMDYDCLEEATWEFLQDEAEHPTVKTAVERFQKLWQNATGQNVVGYRPGKVMDDGNKKLEESKVEILSPERTIQVAEQYFSAASNLMRTLVTKFKSEGKSLHDPGTQQELNTEFAAKATDAGEASLNKMGVTQDQFEASIRAHQEDPMVGRALAQLQMRQQQELMMLGS